MTPFSRNKGEVTPPKLFLIVFFIILSCTCLLTFPIDDGLRHVGVAFSGTYHWGDVYPFSYFSDYSDYSPWYGHDLILRKSLSLLQHIPLKPTIAKFIFVKTLSVAFVLLVFSMLVFRSKILSEIQNFQSLLPSALCVLFFLVPFFLRSMIARPFVFGTIFLIYSFQQSGFWKGAISSSALIFLYPYLSWFYVFPVVFCHFLKGDKKFAYGALIPISIFLILQTPSFWELQAGMFGAGAIRKQMGMYITELASIFNSFYGLSILLGMILLYPFLHQGKKKINYGDLLLLTYLLPAIMYIRTFIDVFLPMAFLTHSTTVLLWFEQGVRKVTESWNWFFMDVKRDISEKCPRYLLKLIESITPNRQRRFSIKPIIVGLFALIIFLGAKINLDQLKVVSETDSLLSAIPQNSTILCSFNQQYRILFVRPDLKIIPSSEIGMPSPKIRNEYINFFKSGSFKALAIKTSATYVVEEQDIYLDPRDSLYLQFVGNNEKLKIWKILY